MQGLGRIDVFPIFESDFSIQEQMNFGWIQFGIRAVVKFCKFNRTDLLRDVCLFVCLLMLLLGGNVGW